MFFQTVKIQGQVSHQILKISTFSLEIVVVLASGVTGGVTTQTLLACLYEFLGPRVEVVGFDAFAPAQFVDRDLATKALQDYVDLLFCGVFPASG